MMKKSILLASVLCLVLAGCGANEIPTAGTTETSAAAETTAQAEETTAAAEESTEAGETAAETTVTEETTAEKSNVRREIVGAEKDDVSGAKPDAKTNVELHADIQKEQPSPEWITNLDAARDENTKQLFVVAGMGMDKTTATVSMHERDKSGNWIQILSTPGFVGLNGLCLDEDHKEGCAQTPIGTYHFNKAFGIADDPGCQIPYVKVDDDTWWSGDDREGMHYNEMVDIKDFPELVKDNSEHITDYEYQYQYCLNISFNEEGAPGRGSAIFLHCFGPLKPYTGGCVALPENIMKLVMQKVTGDCVVVIDTFENLGGSF